MRFYNFDHFFFIHAVAGWKFFKNFLKGKICVFPAEILVDFGGIKFHVRIIGSGSRTPLQPPSEPPDPSRNPSRKKAVCAVFARGLSCFQQSGRSSAWLERYVRDVEVARSNRVAPIFRLFIFLFFSAKQLVFNSFCVMADFFVRPAPLIAAPLPERYSGGQNQRRAFHATRKERTGHPLCCECRSRGGER